MPVMAEPRSNSFGNLGRLFTIPQTADYLQVCEKTIRRWIEGGELIAHRIGRQWRISEADLKTFVAMRRQS